MATSAEIQAEVEGQTVPTAFVKTVQDLPDQVALRWRNEDESWGEWTFADYAERVAAAAAGLADLGVGPGTRVVLMLRNIAEFHVLDMATYFCGGTAVSIYNSSSPDQIQYLAGHCEAQRRRSSRTSASSSRFLKVRDELPALQHLGILRDPDGVAPGDVFSYEELLNGHDPVDLTEAASVAKPEDLATIIYTSGTTGPPKGVMVSHQNIAWTVESLRRTIAFETYAGKRLVSYLPMAHIAERMTSHYQQAVPGLRGHRLPEPRRHRRLRPGGAPAADVRRAPGVGEDARRGHGVAGCRPGEEGHVRRRRRGGQADRRGHGLGPGDRRAARHLRTVLDAAAFANVRAMLGLDAARGWPSPAPRPSPPSCSCGSGPSACRCRRSTA